MKSADLIITTRTLILFASCGSKTEKAMKAKEIFSERTKGGSLQINQPDKKYRI